MAVSDPAIVIACRDCRHWHALQFQAWKEKDRGVCKAMPGGWITDGSDFCALWTERTPPKETPPPCSY